MPESGLRLLLDQNIPLDVARWLRGRKPDWQVWHTNEVGLRGQPDTEIFIWAQSQRAAIATYDEDFADARTFALGPHFGIIRLRVWPTTIEETQKALERLCLSLSDAEIAGSLIIIDRQRIRVRRGAAPDPAVS